jgi:hypothetical protein
MVDLNSLVFQGEDKLNEDKKHSRRVSQLGWKDNDNVVSNNNWKQT